MPCSFFKEGDPVTSEDIDNVEVNTGLSIPDDLRRHYLAYNGGQIKPNCILVRDEYYCVDYFLEIKGRNSSFDFEQTYDRMNAWNQILPSDCIPIATIPGGDLFVYRTGPEFSGQIWCYQHEFPDDPSQAMVRISDSLASFLDSMTAQP